MTPRPTPWRATGLVQSWVMLRWLHLGGVVLLCYCTTRCDCWGVFRTRALLWQPFPPRQDALLERPFTSLRHGGGTPPGNTQISGRQLWRQAGDCSCVMRCQLQLCC